MSSQLNLNQADEGNWRIRTIDPQIRRSCQETDTKVVGSWRGGVLEGVLRKSDQ
jgi:hypothetical protein